MTTDYLLKDEIEEMDPADAPESSEPSYMDLPVRKVTMEEAGEFLSFNEKFASLVSFGVMLCILSPVCLIGLACLQEEKIIKMTEKTAAMMGLLPLFVLIGIAVAIFIAMGLRSEQYKYFEEELIETEYGVTGMVKDRRAKYQAAHTRDMIIGVILCVMSAVPIFIVMMLTDDESSLAALGVCVLLVMVAVGVKIIANTAIIWEGMDKLLEEGDFTRQNKKTSKFDGLYWIVVTAIFLTYSFITMDWGRSWIIWPVAGVLFALYKEIVKMKLLK